MMKERRSDGFERFAASCATCNRKDEGLFARLACSFSLFEDPLELNAIELEPVARSERSDCPTRCATNAVIA